MVAHEQSQQGRVQVNPRVKLQVHAAVTVHEIVKLVFVVGVTLGEDWLRDLRDGVLITDSLFVIAFVLLTRQAHILLVVFAAHEDVFVADLGIDSRLSHDRNLLDLQCLGTAACCVGEPNDAAPLICSSLVHHQVFGSQRNVEPLGVPVDWNIVVDWNEVVFAALGAHDNGCDPI